MPSCGWPYPSPPHEVIMAESIKLPIGHLQTAHNTSTPPTARKPVATRMDDLVVAYKANAPYSTLGFTSLDAERQAGRQETENSQYPNP